MYTPIRNPGRGSAGAGPTDDRTGRRRSGVRRRSRIDDGEEADGGATRRGFLAAVGTATVVAGCLGPGGDDGAGTTVTDDLEFGTDAFDDGGTVPVEYTCDGENRSPPLSVEGVPGGAESLALVVDDPDAPGGTFTHWLLWNVPPDVRSIPGGIPTTETVPELDGARQGTNDTGSIGYAGPCPPEGDDPHTYRFTAYAVETTLELEPGVEKDRVTDALSDATLATGRFTGEYARS